MVWTTLWNGYEVPLTLKAFSKRGTLVLPNLILCGSGTASRVCGSASTEEPTGWTGRGEGQQGWPLRPVLRTVENARDLNRVRLDLIDDYIRQRRECEFAPSRHAAAGPSKIGKILQAGALVVDRSSNASSCFGVIAFDPFADVL